MSLTVFRRESLVPVLDGIRRFNRSIRQKRKNGWHRALYDPNRLLKVFRTLKLRDGYRLAAYHYTAGGNGRGLGFVLPVGVDLPRVPREPRNIALSDWLPEHSLRVTDFLEHATEPAEPMAFLQASLFLREFFELVAAVPQW